MIDRCSTARIEDFLRQELSEAQERQFERHLDTCSLCRDQLDQSTAEVSDWSEAGDFLRDEPFDSQPLGDLCGQDPTEDSHPNVSFDARQIISLLAPTDDPEKLGRVGRYEIAGIIGSGGMGIVLKGFDPSLNRFVAIKVLAPHLASTAAARKRFQREAQAAAAVVHENVLAIHGVDTTNGLPYLVMPYIRGISLEARIHSQGALPLSDILRIGMQTASGLAAAHAQGLVHRDIKPSNILLTDGASRVAITDFGLARTVDDASLTRTGMIAGTPQYMSPEQARGEGVSHHSDLFSLGSVLYAMCTGRPPFRAETSYGVLRRITDNEPRTIRDLNPDIPDWLAAFIVQLHQKNASDRPASATEVAGLLGRCLAHVQQPTAIELPPEIITLAEESRQKVKDRTIRRRLIPIAASVLLLMVALAVAAVDMLAFNDHSPSVQGAAQSPRAAQRAEPQPLDNEAAAILVWDHELTRDLDRLSHEISQLEAELDLVFGADSDFESEANKMPPADADQPAASLEAARTPGKDH